MWAEITLILYILKQLCYSNSLDRKVSVLGPVLCNHVEINYYVGVKHFPPDLEI